MSELLGLPLEVAQVRLADAGIEPVRVTVARAPRRQTDEGHLRVVRVRDGGRALVVCAFLDDIMPEAEPDA